MIRYIIISMRPSQWIKNAFLFAGIIFSKNIFNLIFLSKSFASFFLFCLLSGSIYIINDILDFQEDRIHPEKRKRPIASGKLPIFYAVFSVSIILPITITLSYLLNFSFGVIGTIYIIQNLLYSRYLKHIVIVDIMMIGLGFVLRAIGGALVINVAISHWLILCTFLLALFLGFSKRRHEILLLAESANNHRKILAEYDIAFLDMMIAIVAGTTLIAYALYTVSQETIEKFHTENLIYTTPFVIYGIFRYLYLIHKKGEGGNPSKVLIKDIPLQLNIILWLISIGLIIGIPIK